MEEKAVFEIKKVRITYINAIYDDKEQKKHDRCYITIGFGYFFVTDIGINRDNEGELTWSHNFGWSKFKFNQMIPDNPYYPEVEKVLKLIANEIKEKKDRIVEFLDSNERWNGRWSDFEE
ncbi:hypothetical protein KAU40_02125 [Candidatus Parcubacteria bacterium]|nr:hypothetical protein [Candidatus Parcubacteria bacterium]